MASMFYELECSQILGNKETQWHDIHSSLHHATISENDQQDATV
jgi:hypothetical protein